MYFLILIFNIFLFIIYSFYFLPSSNKNNYLNNIKVFFFLLLFFQHTLKNKDTKVNSKSFYKIIPLFKLYIQIIYLNKLFIILNYYFLHLTIYNNIYYFSHQFYAFLWFLFQNFSQFDYFVYHIICTGFLHTYIKI